MHPRFPSRRSRFSFCFPHSLSNNQSGSAANESDDQIDRRTPKEQPCLKFL